LGVAGGDGEGAADDFGGGGGYVVTVVEEENVGGDEGGAFVAVSERAVGGEAEKVGGGEVAASAVSEAARFCGRDRADCRRARSRRPGAPPCSAICSSWMARTASSVSQRQAGGVIWRVRGGRRGGGA
jgi:hypothetical protein